MYVGLRVNHVKYPLLFSDFNQNLIILDRFSANTHISNLMKTRPVEAGLFNADRQTDKTDMTIATVAFHSFMNAHKKLNNNEQKRTITTITIVKRT
jgi:hypothetical protein